MERPLGTLRPPESGSPGTARTTTSGQKQITRSANQSADPDQQQSRKSRDSWQLFTTAGVRLRQRLAGRRPVPVPEACACAGGLCLCLCRCRCLCSCPPRGVRARGRSLYPCVIGRCCYKWWVQPYSCVSAAPVQYLAVPGTRVYNTETGPNRQLTYLLLPP